MRYLLIHRLDETAELYPAEDSDVPGSPVERALKDWDRAVQAWDEEMEANGVMAGGGRLRPSGEARSVRVRGGEVLVTDGPFAETKEQIAGFNVLECTDLTHAVEVAARHPTAKIGTFELRPFA